MNIKTNIITRLLQNFLSDVTFPERKSRYEANPDVKYIDNFSLSFLNRICNHVMKVNHTRSGKLRCFFISKRPQKDKGVKQNISSIQFKLKGLSPTNALKLGAWNNPTGQTSRPFEPVCLYKTQWSRERHEPVRGYKHASLAGCS